MKMQIEDWVLIKKLGEGGNAHVWEATHHEFGTCALKILKAINPNKEPYKRFVAEVKVLQSLGQVDGILPLISHQLPDYQNKKNPAWLAMPIAIPIRDALDGQDIEETVNAIATIAGVLTQLHGQMIFHRDIKPENLYFAKTYSIGDFGLVDYPEKEGLTEKHKQLGPRHYLAPEMFSNPTTAEGGPADVYSLAKTLWVLATGQRFPFPGEQRLDVPQLGIRSFLGESTKTMMLDRLIERATRHNSSNRPTMAEFEEELRTLFSPATQVLIDPLKEAARTLSVVLTPKIQRNQQIASLVKAVSPLVQQLDRYLEAAASKIKDILEKDFGKLSASGVVSITNRARISDNIIKKKGDDSLIRSNEKYLFINLHPKRMFMGYVLRLYDNEKIEIIANIINRGDGAKENRDVAIWEDSVLSVVGTAKAEKEVEKLFNDLFSQMPMALEKVFK